MNKARSKLRDATASVARWLDGGSRSLPLAIMPGEELLLDRPVAPQPAAEPRPDADGAVRAGRRLLATVFDSSHPVRDRADLFGRDDELDQLLSASLDFRQHSVVHGARGSGKTSLVRVFGDYADQNGVIVIYMACEPGVGFAELMRPYLRSIPSGAIATGMKDQFRRDVAALPADFGPRAFVELVVETVSAPLVLIFDEFDRITDPVVNADVAAAMKLLADSLSSVLFMLVGIARNIGDVVSAHPSLRRHMRTVSLGRIETESVNAMIARGEAAAGIAFDDGARRLIARAACGSPFHVRLFCHYAALAALRRKSAQVGEVDAIAGFAAAFRLWTGMNDDDAGTFRELARDPAQRGGLERFARAVATSDFITGVAAADEPAAALLGPSLEQQRDGGISFRDSTAPQFLIAIIILMEAGMADTPPHTIGREPDDALYR